MIKEYSLTWNEFKKQTNSNNDWIYRGQSSADWPLESTLKRFSDSDIIRVHDYHNMLQSIRSDSRVKVWLEDRKLSLPQENPFLIGLLAANEHHVEEMKKTFRYMHNLRHIGFHTPSIDWTKKHLIATFFAVSNIGTDRPIAIFRLKVKSEQFNPFGLNIYILSADGSHPREIIQESAYTVAVFQYATDAQRHRDERRGPYYCLHSYEGLSEFIEGLVIEKYIIIDSSDRKNKLGILKELYEQDISFEKIYGDTDRLEKTVIQDVAIKSILFDRYNAFSKMDIVLHNGQLMLRSKEF